MENFNWSRLRNYGLWVSIAALIPLVLQVFGIEIVDDKYQTVVNALLTALVTVGVLNDPTTTSKWYLDDSENNDEVENDN